MAELPGALKRTPREIALRACSTQLLLTRWALEASALSAKEPAAAGFGALTEALAKTSITEHMTARERSLHKLDFGKWDVAEDIVGVQSRWESFGMLAWALRIVRDVPEYPNTFPHEQLYQATAVIPAFPNTIDMFVEYFTSGEGSKDGHLVTSAEFEDAVNRAEAWYWRSRAQMVLELKQGLQGDSPEIREARRKVPSGLRGVMDNIEKAISQASQRALADGLISESVDDDFAVAKGVAYRSLDDHGLRDMERMTESRLAALGWLAGTEQWEFERGEVKFINPLGSLWSAE
ncbi:hypothetical protein HK105_200604 [Polyrhizophydium stewartii]|uniref:DUF4272 domain-containing protein n=1 Tax=Polyrhizophydium stewartii TaxID=2732419 RepID=A0ABR4NJJ8_9FUNG|nr:hypothetical protein HK105_005273 [Polyrhizophydium stewartii]